MEKVFRIVHKGKAISIMHKNKIVGLKGIETAVTEPARKLVAKYKFDKSICNNLIPIFDIDLTNYIVVDDYVDIKESVVTRSIYKTKSPTMIRFGNSVQNAETSSLIEIMYLDTTNITNANNMFDNCNNLRKISINNWAITDTVSIENIFKNCNKLGQIIISNSDYNSVNKIIEQLPTRTQDEPGYFFLSYIDDMAKVDTESSASKYWNIKDEQACFILGKSKLGRAKLSSSGREGFILDESILDVDIL